jgi:anti-sigma factor RsiW
MNDQWTDRLSAYVDGELARGEREGLEAHLATCAECRGTLEELRRVVARAKALEDRPPTADLWSGIYARLTPGRRPGVSRDTTARRLPWRVSFNVPQLIAASIVLMLLAGGSVWLALRSRQQAPGTELALFSEGGSPAMNAAWTSTDVAVAELQDALTRNEGRLDTATVRVVRQNLAVIDKAIGEAQRALKADPGNAYLNLHLANTMHQKIELLRRANALAARES